jgi:hypothetical protein
VAGTEEGDVTDLAADAAPRTRAAVGAVARRARAVPEWALIFLTGLVRRHQVATLA